MWKESDSATKIHTPGKLNFFPPQRRHQSVEVDLRGRDATQAAAKIITHNLLEYKTRG